MGDVVKLEHLLLGALLQRPQTGYDLKKFMDVTGRFWRPNTAMTQVYRTLRRLEDGGQITHVVEARPGAQDAKRYRVTGDGKDFFISWLRRTDWVSDIGEPSSPEFLPRLRFAATYLGLDAVVEVLDLEIAGRRRQIAAIRGRDRTEAIAPTIPFDEGLASVTMQWQHEWGVATVELLVERCEELRARLVADEIEDLRRPDLLVRVADERDADATDTASEVRS